MACNVLFAVPADSAEIDFDTEIVPILSKAGCNAASCHGGAAGQAGFRLSLFGGDPEFDYRTIVHELAGRRVNHVRPDRSLVVAKPTGQLDHGGGELLELDGQAATKLSRWIEAGTPRLQLRRLQQLTIDPRDFVADSAPAVFKIKVTAVFDDGLQRDVTTDAVYVSQNDAALNVDDFGTVTVTDKGRHSAIVRFGSLVKMISVTTPLSDVPVKLPGTARKNWVDDEINSTLLLLNLEPAPTTNDASFLRRLSLDLLGRLPTLAQVENFSDNESQDKRSELIDELLGSDEFTSYWTHRLATQLRLRKPGTGHSRRRDSLCLVARASCNRCRLGRNCHRPDLI